jgi:hypothetical protein
MLAILRFRASNQASKAFDRAWRPAYVIGHLPTHWGTIHCPDEVAPVDVWCMGELLSECTQICEDV